MPHLTVYWTLLVLTLGYAWIRGGPPERWAASMLTAASLASMLLLSPLDIRYRHPEFGVAVADLLLLGGYLRLTVRSTRYWPSWLVALQVLQLLSDFSPALPHTLVMVCGIVISILGYPMVTAIAVGTWRHQERLRLGADEAPWRTA